MAKAILRGGLDATRTLKLAHTAEVEAGDVIVSAGHVLVATNAYAADVEGVYIFRGPVEFPKTAPLAIAAGDVCYWDVADGEINKTATDNTKAGIAKKAAASADTTVLVELGENR